MNNEVKLSFWQILFSPFISLKNMVTSKPDVSDDIELNPNSLNKEEATLAKSFEKVDQEVQDYDISNRAQKRNKILEETKVSKEQLSKSSTEINKTQAREDLERGEK